MKIVFLYPLLRDGYNYLRELLPPEIEIVARIRGEDDSSVRPNEDPEIVEACRDADILMGPYFTEEILALAAPSAGGKLKLIIVPWTGVDRVDFELINKYQIPVANSHGNARTVAEHTLALLLAASKSLIHHDRLLRKGDWSSRFARTPSIIISGKTVGLLGYGAIGTECAKLLRSFDVKIIACRRNPDKSSPEQQSLASQIISIDDLDLLLSESDIIINSLPLTNETKGILGKEQFDKMKDGVIFVNVGRALTIDEEAFYEAVKSEKIRGAGLDPQWNYPQRSLIEVDKPEPCYPSQFPIHEFDNVVLSPHRAAHIVGGYERNHWIDVVENILRIYRGEKPLNLVDKKLGY